MKRSFVFLFLIYCCLNARAQVVWDSLAGGLPIASTAPPYNDIGGEITSICIYNGKLYVSGHFGKGSGKPMDGVAEWDGKNWNSTKIDSLYVVYPPSALAVYNNELWVAADIKKNLSSKQYILKWNGTNWTKGFKDTVSGWIIKDITYNNELYAGGWWEFIDSTNKNTIERWNGTKWINAGGSVTGGSSAIFTMEIFNGELYVGGIFYSAGGIPASCIAKWNGTAWDSVGSNGADYVVQSMAADTINNFLYVGGGFLSVGNGIPAYLIARWDGYMWSALKNTLPNTNADFMKMYHGKLYIKADSINGISYQSIAKWDGIKWDSLPGGIRFFEYGPTDPANKGDIEAFLEWKDTLYIGGRFDQAGTIQKANSIVKYYEPWENNCNYLQPIIHALTPTQLPADTFYYTDSVAVNFYNNVKSASNWQWDFGDSKSGNGQMPVHYYKTAGTYTVSVIVSYNGPTGTCIDTAYKTITIIYGTAAVNNIQSQSLKFKIYPNPAKNNITVEVEEWKGGGMEEEYTVRITSPLGQKVAEKKFTKRTEVEVSGFGKGLFLVEVCETPDIPLIPPSKRGTEVRCHTEKVVIE
ncbi:MAG: PKD domain-containing protein [Bacteroidetes bacterium]|nr:PKD domain-containing protein [Bacteroidota bacterium]